MKNLIKKTIGYMEYKQETTKDMLRWENEKKNPDEEHINHLEWEISDTNDMIEQFRIELSNKE